MALGLSREHLDLAEAVRGWASRHSPAEVVRAAADRPGRRSGEPGSEGGRADSGADSGPDGPGAPSDVYSSTLRPRLAEQGLLGLHVPESHGGQGYGMTELAVALEELGRALVPGGFLPTVLASAVLLAGDGPQKLITGLTDGSAAGAVSLAAGLAGRAGPHGGLILDGTSSPVLGASLADLVILPAQTDHGEVWVAVDATDLEVTALDSLDLTRPSAQVHADHVLVAADRILAGLGAATATTLAATLLGAEACGIADWAVHTAAEYAKIRHQFGRPIGQFQAVKHRCAWMLTMAEQAVTRAGKPNLPPRWQRWWLSTRPSAARTNAFRCSAASVTRGNTMPTSTTAGRCRYGRCSARPASGRTGWRAWPWAASAGHSK